MRFYLQKAAAVGFLVFLVLWVAGTLRGITLDYPLPTPITISEFRSSQQQFQGANNLKQLGLGWTALPLVLDHPKVELIRIHDKRAILAIGTSEFTKDEAAIRDAIKEQNKQEQKAEIFTEHRSGIEPNRKLAIEIGVHPDNFDALVDKLQTIGTLSSITVEQKDRTGEFRTLFAKRQSLKKHLEAIVKLREGKSPTLEDSLRLEGKIQEIEKEMQGLSVQFGDLIGAETYYHIHVTLAEHVPGGKGDKTYTMPQRVGHAFLWATAWWFAVALACCVAAGACMSVWVLMQRQAR